MSLKIYSAAPDDNDPEWRNKAWAIKWLANNRCQMCNCRLAPGCGHVHHNTYEQKGNEKPRDLIALCDLCHALYHWAKSARDELLWWIEQKKRETGEMSARLWMLHEWMELRRKALQARLDDILAELVTLEAGFKTEREYGDGRRAA